MPASLSKEIEFKFAVDDEQAFHLLAKQLRIPESTLDNSTTQFNHFFDSPSFCLHTGNLALRMREQEGCYVFTLKGEASLVSQDHAALSERIEEETSIPANIARDLLEAQCSPVDVIKQYFSTRAAVILAMINDACNQQPLRYVGMFRNERIVLPTSTINVGSTTIELVFELDCSTFPDGSTEYEIEVEISDRVDAGAVSAALNTLLEQAGIKWKTAPSKAARFFDRL